MEVFDGKCTTANLWAVKRQGRISKNSIIRGYNKINKMKEINYDGYEKVSFSNSDKVI